MRIRLTPEVGHTIDPDMYYALRLPGASGEADFVANIEGCASSKMKIGDALTVESAATTMDTVRGVADLIARDPSRVLEFGHAAASSARRIRAPAWS